MDWFERAVHGYFAVLCLLFWGGVIYAVFFNLISGLICVGVAFGLMAAAFFFMLRQAGPN